MKFYGNGIVWDGENNKTLCQFVNGEFETEDARIANKLLELNYSCDVKEIGAVGTGSNDEYVTSKAVVLESDTTVIKENPTIKPPVKK